MLGLNSGVGGKCCAVRARLAWGVIGGVEEPSAGYSGGDSFVEGLAYVRLEG